MRTQTAETFTFVLTPDDDSYPMPEEANADTITVTGAGKVSFDAITYSEPNNYTYTLREIAGDTTGYTYDATVYQVTVYVMSDDDGSLTAKVRIAADGSDGKAKNAIFTNHYKKPVKPDPNSPQTSDTSNMPLWIVLAASSASLLLLMAVKETRRRKVR